LARGIGSFAKNHSNVIPVLDENNCYVGYYEIDDIMTFSIRRPFKEQGSIIKVKKNTQDYSMGQIAQIVESNNGKL
jgi:hypothetical protein